MVGIPVHEVERWLDLLYVAAEGARLRREERKKAVEISAMLAEIGPCLGRISPRSRLILVDAAAGKSYLGLLAAKLLIEPLNRPASVVCIERDPRRAELSRKAAARLETPLCIEVRALEVGDPGSWPEQPSVVAALHACGPAADAIIDRAVAANARYLLLVPCCTSRAIPAARWAEQEVARRSIPPHAPVRRRFIQVMVDAERTWRLEAAGYQTEVVEFVSGRVTPHNLLWRARRVKEPKRMAAALKAWQALTASTQVC